MCQRNTRMLDLELSAVSPPHVIPSPRSHRSTIRVLRSSSLRLRKTFSRTVIVPRAGSRPSFRRGLSGNNHLVLVAASTVAIVAIAAAVIVVALLVFYILPRGGRRKRPPRT